MVRLFYFVLSLFHILSLFGQVNCDSIPQFFVHPEKELPIFDKSAENDIEKLFDFIKTNIVYPITAKEDRIEGLVIVGFKIETTGATSEHKIIQGIREDLNNEALRVAKLIKFDEPAIDYFNKPLAMCYRLPIRFKLSDPNFLLYKQSEKFKPKSKNKTKQR